jgi:pseudoazurin
LSNSAKILWFLCASAMIGISACSDSGDTGNATEATGAAEVTSPITSPSVNSETPTQPADQLAPAAPVPSSVLESGGDEAAKSSESESPAGDTPAPQQHIVKGVVTQWQPMVLFVQPGDRIIFKQMIGHDTATIDGMYPSNGISWQSKLGEEGFSVVLEEPGVYMYKCTPHVSLGMIGAIVVGDLPPANLQQLEDHPQNKGMFARAIRKLKLAIESKAGGSQ